MHACLECHLALGLARGDDGDDGSHGGADLDRHVTETAEADDAQVRPLLDAVLLQRAVARDAGAQQGRGRGHVHLRGDDDCEGLVDDDVRGVAAVRDSAGVALLVRVGVRLGLRLGLG